MPFEIGQQVRFDGKTSTIVEIIKGGKTKNPNIQGGIVTGYKSKPRVYKLDNGLLVRGDKLIKSKPNEKIV
jgi:hypothetical protein